ncbi:MAG: GNAT family N-acetyltransferase [Chloroflexi bacterium]|nr:GNAT family N-acetyltransferase [Chloroflexota bacterium]
MFPLQLENRIVLRPFADADADALFDLIRRNRVHLDPWLRWSGRIQSLDDTRQLIQRFADKQALGDGFHAGLWVEQQLAGGVVIHFINRESRKCEIGYWLGADYVGRGLVTRAARVVIERLFSVEGLHRIEIQAVTDNQPSRAVAERLGFTFEGIKRESEWVTSAFRDHALYALLEQDWHA